MTLLVNGTFLGSSTLAFGAASHRCTGRMQYNRLPLENNHCYGEGATSGVSDKMAVPGGYQAWVPPIRGGDMVSRNEIETTTEVAGAMNAGKNMEGALDTSLSMSATASLIVALLAEIGTGCALAAAITGVAVATANMTTTHAIAAAMGALGVCVADMTTAHAVTGSIGATATMSANITSVTELSPENLAAAVWNALVAQFQGAGSMGEALGTAGSGGLSPTQQQQLRELWELAGLDNTKPLVITETTRKVPADGSSIEQTIDETPTTTTVTRG